MGQNEKIRIIVESLYEKGHGKEMTVQRIMDVIGLNRAAATIAFTAAEGAIRAEERMWIAKGQASMFLSRQAS